MPEEEQTTYVVMKSETVQDVPKEGLQWVFSPDGAFLHVQGTPYAFTWQEVRDTAGLLAFYWMANEALEKYGGSGNGE